MKAAEYPKLHHEDPSGFWNLVRTGKKLPAPGQRILYVHDIRGTRDEARYNLLISIAGGNPYKHGIVAKKQPGQKVYEHEVLLDELLKLPTAEYKPETRVGIVESVEYDKVLEEWYILLRAERGWPIGSVDPDHIVYWAPFPEAPNTYTPRPDNPYIIDFDAQRLRETRVQDYLELRAARRRA